MNLHGQLMKGYTQLPQETLPLPPFFSPPNSHSIFDLSLPVFKGNQQNIFQIYAWNNTSKFSWKPRTMDSNEFLIILNFTVFLPSLLTTVGPQVINYLSLSFESYIFFFFYYLFPQHSFHISLYNWWQLYIHIYIVLHIYTFQSKRN